MQHEYNNELVNETSPYLLQHAHNPVNWTGWNQGAFEKAKKEDKLLIISIGYSACHWCHVMEHESFEDTAVAGIMNEHFVSIKVDREERPDVDQIYMDAVQLITGRGGWPLNAIALPDGKPIYAGTYFPKEHWIQVLLYFVDYWKNHRAEALERAEEITRGIKITDSVTLQPNAQYISNDRAAIFAKFDSVTDYERGGRRGAPKFPMPVNYRYLLRNYYYTQNNKALKAVTVTLDNMMNGGIYDHVGGGFARYSVDADWIIPHFEKMLYDNAQLISLYAEAYQVTGNIRYREVVEGIYEFCERELSDSSGGFYAALDADSEGEEGKFYVWTYQELKQILGSRFDEFSTVYDISEQGNFEGKNNLVRRPGTDNVNGADIKLWQSILLEERNKRIRPRLDDKILTSWNALMISGCLDAYNALGDSRFLERALKCGAFIETQMLQADYSLKRNYKNGKANISGFLDDYSFTCNAFISLYQATFNHHWLSQANNIATYVIQHFSNINNGLFFYTSINDDPLIARKTETSDNVIPASNSCMAIALFKLGTLLDNQDYLKIARRAADNIKASLTEHPLYYANWAILCNWLIDAPYEIAICGENALALNSALNKHFLPNAIISGSTEPSAKLPLLIDKYKTEETLIYVCQNKTCQLPVKEVGIVLQQIGTAKG